MLDNVLSSPYQLYPCNTLTEWVKLTWTFAAIYFICGRPAYLSTKFVITLLLHQEPFNSHSKLQLVSMVVQ
jgi:hypothetical protein